MWQPSRPGTRRGGRHHPPGLRARGVGVVTAAEREAKEKRRRFDLAYAMAYSRTEGPVHVRRYEADIASMPHRKEAEDAEITFRHAERTARALERELMAAM